MQITFRKLKYEFNCLIGLTGSFNQPNKLRINSELLYQKLCPLYQYFYDIINKMEQEMKDGRPDEKDQKKVQKYYDDCYEKTTEIDIEKWRITKNEIEKLKGINDNQGIINIFVMSTKILINEEQD
jgi:hypothetical protein